MKLEWRYPVFEAGIWRPDKEDWPTSYAYHILQMKESADNAFYHYNEDDLIIAWYDHLLECWRTESGMDYIKCEEVKRWAVLLDDDGQPIKDMEDDGVCD